MKTTPFATAYARITGPVLLLTGVAGIVALATGNAGIGTQDRSFVLIEWDQTHNVAHLLLGAIATYVGFATNPLLGPIAYGKLFGVVYVGLAALGFASGSLFGIGEALGLHVELGENLIHLGLGALGLVAGFVVSSPDGQSRLFRQTPA